MKEAPESPLPLLPCGDTEPASKFSPDTGSFGSWTPSLPNCEKQKSVVYKSPSLCILLHEPAGLRSNKCLFLSFPGSHSSSEVSRCMLLFLMWLELSFKAVTDVDLNLNLITE